MTAAIDPPRWPFTEPNARLTIDFSRGVPGLLAYEQVKVIDAQGEVHPVTAKPSQVIPDGLSLTYWSHEALAWHLRLMGWHKQKLAEFDKAAPTVERPVLHVGSREGRQWARQAIQVEQGSLL